MPAGCVQKSELSAFGKAIVVSTFQQRRRSRHVGATPPNREVNREPRRNNKWLNYASANAVPIAATLALVWLATISLIVIDYFAPLNLVPLVYMLPVVLAATQWGIVPGLVAAAAGATAADFFFYPPLYSLWLQNTQDVIDLLLYLVVAIVTSNLAARLKNETISLSRREKEISELHTFSRGLATCLTGRDLIFAVQDYLSNTLGYRAVFIAASQDHRKLATSNAGVPEAVRNEAGKLMAAHNPDAWTVLETEGQRAWLVRTIAPEILGYGAIAVELGDGAGERAAATARRVEAMLAEAAAMLKHLKVKEAIEQATIDYRAGILRDALIGGISHELRTPLASILGSCSVLNEAPAIVNDPPARALVETIHGQAGQLDCQIRDLLNAARISANGVRPQMMWTDPTDIVSAALKQRERRLVSHRLIVDVAADIPLVYVDSVLVEQALGQLLENAAKYSPTGSEIKISGRHEQDRVVLSVKDQGCGLTPDEKGQLGQRSFRGQRHSAGSSGSGLGLWIASTFIVANGGTLHAESPGPNGGSTISLELPIMSEDTPELVEGVSD